MRKTESQVTHHRPLEALAIRSELLQSIGFTASTFDNFPNVFDAHVVNNGPDLILCWRSFGDIKIKVTALNLVLC